MRNNLEEMMFRDGWKQSVRWNAGKVYRTWHKDGFYIDDEDIIEEKGAKEND